MPTKDEDAIRRALAMLKNRGVEVTTDAESFGKKFSKFLKPIRFLVAGIGTAYFYLFILEEAVQTAGFGVFTLIQAKMWKEAAAQNRKYREIVQVGIDSTSILTLKNVTKIETEEVFINGHRLWFPQDVLAEVYNEVIGLGEDVTSYIFLPFSEFFEAAASASSAYDARIASELRKINPQYYDVVQQARKDFAVEKFKVKQAHDARNDNLAVLKKQELDDLSIMQKEAGQQLAALKREKQISKDEADAKTLELARIRDAAEIEIKKKYDELQRAEAENHFNEMILLERVEQNRLDDLRAASFPLDEDSTITLPPEQPLPSPAPVNPPELPTPPPIAPPAPQPQTPSTSQKITIIIQNLAGTRIKDFPVVIGGTGFLTDENGMATRTHTFSGQAQIIAGPLGDLVYSPTEEKIVNFKATFADEFNGLLEFDTLENVRAHAAAITPLPPDNNQITGVTTSVEFGLIEPPAQLGNPPPAADLNIINKREFTLAEVSNITQEILAVRLNLTGPFTNSKPLDVDYKLERPDGSVLITPERPDEIIPIPADRGYQYWNWTKHGAVYNGDGVDLRGKGIYKLTLTIDGGNPPSGFYEIYFKVV